MNWRTRRWLLLIMASVSLLLIVDRAWPPTIDRTSQISTLALDAQGRILRGFTVPPGIWRLPATVADVDPRYLAMLLAYEDQRFDQHPGVDPLAVVRASGQWLRHGRIVSGASTLRSARQTG